MPSEFNVSYLYGQLQIADKINENRLETWNAYYESFRDFENDGKIILPRIPKECNHNAHMFYIKLKSIEERTQFINNMKEKGIGCVFHYVPLHSSEAGKRFGTFCGVDIYTSQESDKLVRLPMYYGMSDTDKDYIIESVKLLIKWFLFEIKIKEKLWENKLWKI